MASFWGISLASKKCKKAIIPESCELELTNVALENGKNGVFYVQIDEEPKICVAVLSETCPQHSFSMKIAMGSVVKCSNEGDGTISLVGCQRFIDEDEEIPSDYEDYDEDEDEDEEDFDDEDEEEEDDDEEEDEEEEEKPKKGVKRPEPKVEKKAEIPAKQQKKPEQKKPEQKKPEQKKPEQKKVESSGPARCEICKRNFNTERAYEQHMAAKHGKK